MFSTLESTWDQSASRGRATLVSFSIQAFSLGLLIAISMFWVERPPQVRWLQISAPAFTPPAAPQVVRSNHNAGAASDPRSGQVIALPVVPRETLRINDAESVAPAPDFPTIDTGSGHRPSVGVLHGLGDSIPIVIPPRPPVAKPLLVSHWAEGNLIYRVQPVYPPLAREARIQGTVELRAIVSKAGTIENLAVVSGHPMLVKSALQAVRQWRYRPYLLNSEPIEVETEITVNFVLSGN